MKSINKVAGAIIVFCLICAVSFFLLSESGSNFLGQLSNFLQIGGPLMMIIFVGGIIGFVMIIGFLFGMPIPGRDINMQAIKDSQGISTSTNGVVVDIPVHSGFKFGVGFMLGIAVTGVFLIPLLLIMISSVLSGVVGKL